MCHSKELGHLSFRLTFFEVRLVYLMHPPANIYSRPHYNYLIMANLSIFHHNLQLCFAADLDYDDDDVAVS